VRCKKRREEDREEEDSKPRESTEMRMMKTAPVVELQQTFESKTLVARPGVSFIEFILKPGT
jgi:hypothetical protein